MSSGATGPARAPASMAMLEMDMRASIDSERIAEPANSMVAPVPPAVPMIPQMCSTTSLEVTPGESSPSTCTSMLSAFFWFSVDVASYGTLETVELVAGGADVAVTERNKRDFVNLRFREALLGSYRANVAAFLRGVYAVVPPEAFLLVSARELELLLCGTPDLDVRAWRAHTVYKGAFAAAGDAHPVVKWFWECLDAFPPKKRAQLLQWTTGHSRVPVQGFSHLQGRDGVLRPFTLTSVALDAAIFPRAHTCFNRIDVPLYKTRADLVQAFTLVLDLGDCTFSMD